jgi:hypothetical protein
VTGRAPRFSSNHRLACYDDGVFDIKDTIPMPGMESLGRVLLVLGGLLALVGLVLTFAGRFSWFGQLPGDIHIQRGNFSCSFPLVTSLLLSLLLTVVLNLILRLLRK